MSWYVFLSFVSTWTYVWSTEPFNCAIKHSLYFHNVFWKWIREVLNKRVQQKFVAHITQSFSFHRTYLYIQGHDREDRVLPNHDRPRSSRLERNRLSFSKSKGIDAGLYGECPSWCYGVYFCVLGDSFSKGVVTQQHSQQRAILHDLPSSSLTKESNKNLLHTLPRVSHSIVLTCIFKDTTERTLPTKGYLIWFTMLVVESFYNRKVRFVNIWVSGKGIIWRSFLTRDVSISIKSMTTKALFFTVHYKVYSNYVFKFVHILCKKIYVRYTEQRWCRSYGYVAIDIWLWVYYNRYMVIDLCKVALT